MQDKQREQRRHKRLEKRKKQRGDLSRPGLGGPTASFDPTKGKTWPVSECYASENADEPAATIELVLARSREDGISVVSIFEIDRSGPGIVAVRAAGGLKREQIAGECARLSERTGRAMIGCSGALVAALVDDARKHGRAPPPAALERALVLLEDLPRTELPCPFGPGSAGAPQEAPPSQGFWAGLRKRLVG